MEKGTIDINDVLEPWLDQLDGIRRSIRSACNNADWLTATIIAGHLEAIIFEFNQKRAYMLAEVRKEMLRPEGDAEEIKGPYESR